MSESPETELPNSSGTKVVESIKRRREQFQDPVSTRAVVSTSVVTYGSNCIVQFSRYEPVKSQAR
jgi:hypothetical protein